MFKMLGAAVAAVVLTGAGNAAAATTIFEETGSGSWETRNFDLSGPGLYRATLTSSAAVYLDALAQWDIHWDIFRAPPPRPHSDYIEGNTEWGSAGDALFGTFLTFDFVIPEETYRWFNSPASYEDYGIPTGSLMYEWTRPENMRFRFHFDDDGRGTVADYSFLLTKMTAVPEPATWAILILGFGLAGSALRRRRQPALDVGCAVVP